MRIDLTLLNILISFLLVWCKQKKNFGCTTKFSRVTLPFMWRNVTFLLGIFHGDLVALMSGDSQ